MPPLLTAYDPLGGTSGSIDPLGAMQTYGALADLLLPGISTITTRSRYRHLDDRFLVPLRANRQVVLTMDHNTERERIQLLRVGFHLLTKRVERPTPVPEHQQRLLHAIRIFVHGQQLGELLVINI
jgi:hypothetical protein